MNRRGVEDKRRLNSRHKARAATQNRQAFFIVLFAIGAAMMALSAFAQSTSGSKQGVILSLTGPVTPPTAQYLAREIKAASDAQKELIILEIDTPGGLVDSMKTIIKAILASDTPVATFVSPQGARSASAGLYIMYSAHISVMAPATNTGAATPVEVGGSEPPQRNPFEREEPAEEAAPEDGDAAAGNESEETVSEAESEAEPVIGEEPLSSPDALRAKVINDSVAYIRALAEERGRNADWAESAVRDAASVTANEALELNVIDLVADDIDDLLVQIDGRTVDVASGEKTLDTSNLALERIEATLVERILSFIANPNVATILLSLATTGIIIEMWNPGSIFPGALGVTCLVLALYSFQVLPFNWLPLALMGIGVILIVVEAYSPTFGLAGLAGLVLLGVGMYFLYPDTLRVSPLVIASILALSGSLLAFILVALVASRSHGPMIGGEAIRKREGIVDEWDGEEGWVIVEGERWRARADKPLTPGDRVRVVEVDGLVLVVKQAKASSLLSSLVAREA
ncbi:MAG: nodulation protein NfeD [Pseudomonadota bacterium]